MGIGEVHEAPSRLEIELHETSHVKCRVVLDEGITDLVIGSGRVDIDDLIGTTSVHVFEEGGNLGIAQV